MKPFLLDRNTIFLQISIEKYKRIIYDELSLSEEFSTFFEDVVRSLSVNTDEYYLNDTENVRDPVEIAIRRLKTIQVFKLLIKIFQ